MSLDPDRWFNSPAEYDASVPSKVALVRINRVGESWAVDIIHTNGDGYSWEYGPLEPSIPRAIRHWRFRRALTHGF